ncbi:unnamed protein product, partial [marine sediment metagenome]
GLNSPFDFAQESPDLLEPANWHVRDEAKQTPKAVP